MTEQTSSRLVGLFLLVVGLGLTASNEYTARTEGVYDMKSALVGPFGIVQGLSYLIHAPRFPISMSSPRDFLYGLVSAGCGVANLYRYGAFSETSPDRGFNLAVVGLLVAGFAYGWAVRRPTVK